MCEKRVAWPRGPTLHQQLTLLNKPIPSVTFVDELKDHSLFRGELPANVASFVPHSEPRPYMYQYDALPTKPSVLRIGADGRLRPVRKERASEPFSRFCRDSERSVSSNKERRFAPLAHAPQLGLAGPLHVCLLLWTRCVRLQNVVRLNRFVRGHS